jgi:hypothetical protein
MHRTLVALATTAILLICAPASAIANTQHKPIPARVAWTSSGDFLSCGEGDFKNVSADKGWKATLYQDGAVIKTWVFEVKKAGNVSIPAFATSLGSHYMVMTLANAANPNDGKSSVNSTFIDCLPPTGPAGPPGQPGPPGLGYDCTGTAVPTGGTPAMCPGTPGPPGKTVIVRQAPKVCESTRSYAFRVRQAYNGQKIVSIKAAYEAPKGEESIKAKVTHEHGRLVVRWST